MLTLQEHLRSHFLELGSSYVFLVLSMLMFVLVIALPTIISAATISTVWFIQKEADGDGTLDEQR